MDDPRGGFGSDGCLEDADLRRLNEDEAEGTKLYISVFTVFRKAVVF